ncbi:hypothetical protein [Synechococcus sp. 1G10]|uniref:hypothetical protein n=1 Tax=Synechococcus sp. 1G10 TaxID=2025605 RepID=UPI000B99C19E|nr:hypothetical protein [Synechococcus sp. 1G10]
MKIFDGRLALIAPNLASYPEGGGHWSWFLQYAYGLRDLNIEFFWLEFITQDLQPSYAEHSWIPKSLRLIGQHGFLDNYRLVLHRPDPCFFNATDSIVLGGSGPNLREIIGSCEAVWSFAGAGPREILSQFRKVVLIDVDPGHLQVGNMQLGQTLDAFDVCCTVGLNYNDKSCMAPKLGRQWFTFPQVVHLPLWKADHTEPRREAPITTITSWAWDWLEYNGQLISVSKRDAYLRYLDLPRRSMRGLQLAVDVGDDRETHDRSVLQSHGWMVVDPYTISGSVQAYQTYIQKSAAELCCPKPIYRELRTGWMSDRSAAYLASGRPVIMEDTGFDPSNIAKGGLLTFHDMESAAEAIRIVFSNYKHHSRRARLIAEELCSGRRVLPMLIDQTFASLPDQQY